jgi:diacylglycerol kinase (ATP)
MTMKTVLIYNPTAGPWDMLRPLKRLSAYLRTCGWDTELVQTQQEGDAGRYAREGAERNATMVLVAGGDGTINEVANGLTGTDTVLGIVPVGTGNILAQQLRMPILSPVAPIVRDIGDVLIKSRVQRVDMGMINDRGFVCWAGLGLDAEIATQMEPRPRHLKRFRTLPYIFTGLAVASEYRGVRARFRIGERVLRTRTLMAVATNIQLYAAFFQIAPQARMDDGLLDIFVFKGMNFSYALKSVVEMLGKRHQESPNVMYALAKKMDVETSPVVAVHLDGDPMGYTPAHVHVTPGALRLLVPPNAPDSLFTKPPENH